MLLIENLYYFIAEKFYLKLYFISRYVGMWILFHELKNFNSKISPLSLNIIAIPLIYKSTKVEYGGGGLLAVYFNPLESTFHTAGCRKYFIVLKRIRDSGGWWVAIKPIHLSLVIIRCLLFFFIFIFL